MKQILSRLLKIMLFWREKNIIYGYENEKLLKILESKSISYRSRIEIGELDLGSLRTISAVGLAASGKKKLTVVDFGGGFGQHYLAAKFCFTEIEFSWKIIETANVVKKSKMLNSDSRLEFHEQIEQVDPKCLPLDLIFSNSALQYTQNPIQTMLSLINLNPRVISLTRIPLTNGDVDISYNQVSRISSNGPAESTASQEYGLISYPNQIVTLEKFKRVLESRYRVVFHIDEGFWDWKRFKGKVGTHTFHCERID